MVGNKLFWKHFLDSPLGSQVLEIAKENMQIKEESEPLKSLVIETQEQSTETILKPEKPQKKGRKKAYTKHNTKKTKGENK